jgi:hypothetical protein
MLAKRESYPMASTQIPIFCNELSLLMSVMPVIGTVTLTAGGPARLGPAPPPPSLGGRTGRQSFCEDSPDVSGRKLRSWLHGARWPAALPREVSSDAHHVSTGKTERHDVGGLIKGVGGVARMSRRRFQTLRPDMAFLPHRQHLLSLVRL